MLGSVSRLGFGLRRSFGDGLLIGVAKGFAFIRMWKIGIEI
jgi:hypothetical protein